MTREEAMAIRQYQLNGGKVLAAELKEAIEVLSRRRGRKPQRRTQRAPRVSSTPNPWGLSDREVETLTILAETGCGVITASRMGVSPKAIEGHVRKSARKIGVANRTLAVLEMDRFQRSAA